MIPQLVALCAGAAVFLAARSLGRSDARWLSKRIAPHVTARVELGTPATLATRRSRHPRVDELLDATEERLHGRAWEAFCTRVERADLPMRAVEILYVAVALAAVCAAVGFAVLGEVGGVLGPLLIATVVWNLLGTRARRRLKAFEEQLPDLLSMLAGSLRAGHGFLQSLQAVAADAREPARKELRRVLAETRLGRPLEEALADLGRRLPSEDLLFVLTSITVQRQVGGSLAALFETVNDVVRQRQQFGRRVRTMTSTGRASAQILAVLPFAVLGFLTAANHSYTAPLFDTRVGRLMLLGSACSTIVGSLVLRRIASLRGVVR